MKIIIYTDLEQAQQDLNSCNIISQGKIEVVGGGIFELRELPAYTSLIKKWDEDIWGLLADEKVEQLLNKTAVEIPSNWHKTTLK